MNDRIKTMIADSKSIYEELPSGSIRMTNVIHGEETVFENMSADFYNKIKEFAIIKYGESAKECKKIIVKFGDITNPILESE